LNILWVQKFLQYLVAQGTCWRPPALMTPLSSQTAADPAPFWSGSSCAGMTRLSIRLAKPARSRWTRSQAR